MKLNFDEAVFRMTPYPIGLAKPVFDEASYTSLVEHFPPVSLLPHWGGGGYHKYALNEKMPLFHKYLEAHPVWGAFHASVKQSGFPTFIFLMLKAHGIDIPPARSWSTRFEFAAMPADGGMIAPHTDISSKVCTLVFSMLRPNEWNPDFGGGLDVLQPLNGQVLESYKAPLSAFEKVHTYDYIPNQCVIFIKTDNSWHSVGPMTGRGSSLMRRTITLNIERVE